MGYKVKATGMLVEKNPSSATNSPSSAVTDYESFPNTNFNFYVPEIVKVNDGNRSGRNAPSHTCNTYWEQPDMSISDEIDIDAHAKDLQQFTGGAPVKSVVATGVNEFKGAILPPQVGNILPARARVTRLGDAFFIWAGMTGDKLKIAQTAGERAKIDMNFVGTGKFIKNPSPFTPFPDPASPECLDGHKTILKYLDSDGTTTVNLNSLGNWLNYEFNHDNLLRRGYRRGGDLIQIVSDANNAEGAYVTKIPRGNADNSYNTALRVMLDYDDLTYWLKTIQGLLFTNFSILFKGPKIATVSSTDYYKELEIIIPKFTFESLKPDNDNGDSTQNLGILPLEDPITKGTFTYRYRTLAASFAGVSS